MWEEGVRIYGTPGIHNNFPLLRGYVMNIMIDLNKLESSINNTAVENNIILNHNFWHLKKKIKWKRKYQN